MKTLTKRNDGMSNVLIAWLEWSRIVCQGQGVIAEGDEELV